MKTLFIFYGLLALAALLIASCIQEPLVEEPASKASSVQVTVGAGIIADPATKSEVAIEDGARVLKFTEGDRLYVYGSSQVGGYRNVKGMLTMVENSLAPDGKSAKFTGSLEAYDGNNWISTPNFGDNDPLAHSKATLVHKDMVENRDYQFVTNNGELSVIAKPAPDVETLMTKSLSVKGNYNSSTKSFALSGVDAIFNSVFTGLAPSTNYNCQLRYSLGEGIGYVTSGNHSFSTDANGMNSHAFCLQNPDSGEHPWEIEIKQNGTTIGIISLGTRTLEKKIYNVTRRFVNLSQIHENFTAADGDIISGSFVGSEGYITIADGATVTLSGVSLNSITQPAIACEGDATIILNGNNSITAFHASGVYWPSGKTLIIRGDGKLEATGNSGAGIGGYHYKNTIYNCGNIVIEGGEISASATQNPAAGIGSASSSNCGNITISGGIINASSGNDGAGIGSGSDGSCGNILISGGTIKNSVGNGAGIGSGNDGTCGDILISGGTIGYYEESKWKGGAVGGTEAAGIGTAQYGYCGSITITSGITSIRAVMNNNYYTNTSVIGLGRHGSFTSGGKVTIDGVDMTSEEMKNPTIITSGRFQHLSFEVQRTCIRLFKPEN